MKTGNIPLATLEIDRQKREVWLAGTKLDLPDLTHAFLVALADAAPDPVDANQLQTRVWGDIQVGPDTIKQRARLLRETLRQGGCEGDPVPAVRHRGYRLATPVRFANTEPPPSAWRRARWPLAMVAVIALLAAALSVRALRPLPETLTIDYATAAQQPPGLIETIAAQLAAIDGIEMRLRETGNGAVRLDAQIEGEAPQRRVRLRLISQDDGRLIASETYPLANAGDLDAIDRIAAHFVFRTQDRLVAAFPRQILLADAPPDTAVVAYLAALDAAATGHQAGLALALDQLDTALALAPDFATAHSRRALVLARMSRSANNDPELARRALESARTAARIAPLQVDSDRALGIAYWASGDLDQAWTHLSRARQRRAWLARDLAALARDRDARAAAAD